MEEKYKLSLDVLEKEFKNIKKDIKNKGYEIKQINKNGDLFIPNILILDKNTTIYEKFYISSYYLNNKNINKTDEYMLKQISKNHLKRIKNKLSKLLYIKEIKLNNEEIKHKTIKLSHKGNKCEWCGKESFILQEHHYPIQKKDGGNETVKICPNCHYTYHYLKETKQYK